MGRAFEPMEYLAKAFELDAFEIYCIENVWKTPGKTPEELWKAYGKDGVYGHYFGSDRVLMRCFFRCIENTGCRHLILDERMSIFLQGNIQGYAPYDLLWERIDPLEDTNELIGTGPVIAMERFLEDVSAQKPVWFHLYGKRGIGKRSRIKELCRKKKRSLLVIDAQMLAEEENDLLENLLRECRIYGAWILIRNLWETWFTPSLRREKILSRLGSEAGVIFTVGDKSLQPNEYEEAFFRFELELPMPDYQESCRLWKDSFEKFCAGHLQPEEWANKFLFTPGQIREAVFQASAAVRAEGREQIQRTDLQKGCYKILGGGMGKRAVRIPATYQWDELILPPYQKQKLRDACNQAANQKRVYENWGFHQKIAYGKGISVVFAGPPGTGKTMAAQVMASELCLDLYRVELPAIVSKYVGETEKNLEEIFEQAKKSQVILFFDEADVLFSKRTEIRDSNDKYSNMEAAFLLQKMEEYEGITVLATNFLQNFDEAFKRRMKFMIDFPFPEEPQRLQMWKQIFPKETPVEEELDYEFLASSFELSGSNIKNAALHAAFLAAADETRVGMRHVIAGIRNEYSKSGKTMSREQLGQYYMLL